MPNINKKTCKPEIKINEDYDTVKKKKKKHYSMHDEANYYYQEETFSSLEVYS